MEIPATSGTWFPKVILAARAQQLLSQAVLQHPRGGGCRGLFSSVPSPAPTSCLSPPPIRAGTALTPSAPVGPNSAKELDFLEAVLPAHNISTQLVTLTHHPPFHSMIFSYCSVFPGQEATLLSTLFSSCFCTSPASLSACKP